MSKVSPEQKLDWAEKIRKQQESGLSIEKWCQQNQIPTHQFHYWKARLLPQSKVTRANFKEITAREGTGITLEYQAVRIHLDPNFEPSILKQCLTILKEVVC